MSAEGKTPAHGGDVWKAQDKWGIAPQAILDFSANINPLGPSPRALKAIEEQLPLIRHYPEPGAISLKNELARYLGVLSEQVVLGNGGSELIYLAARLFYKGRVLLLAPCFSEYGQGLPDAHIRHFPLKREEGFRLPVKAFCMAIKPDDLIFIGNPNNPTGNLFERSGLIEIVEQGARIGARVVIDEAFLDFVGDPGQSLRDRTGVNQNLIMVSSLTKFFAIPGLRLGYAVVHPRTALLMEKLLPAWRINSLAAVAARASLSDHSYINETIGTVKREREFLQRELPGLGLTVYPGVSNFLLLEIPAAKTLSARMIQELLGPAGILIRNCDNFENLTPGHFRIAVKKRPQNLRLLEALKEVLA